MWDIAWGIFLSKVLELAACIGIFIGGLAIAVAVFFCLKIIYWFRGWRG